MFSELFTYLDMIMNEYIFPHYVCRCIALGMQLCNFLNPHHWKYKPRSMASHSHELPSVCYVCLTNTRLCRLRMRRFQADTPGCSSDSRHMARSIIHGNWNLAGRIGSLDKLPRGTTRTWAVCQELKKTTTQVSINSTHTCSSTNERISNYIWCGMC